MKLTKRTDIPSDSIPTDGEELYEFAQEIGAIEGAGDGLNDKVRFFFFCTLFCPFVLGVLRRHDPFDSIVKRSFGKRVYESSGEFWVAIWTLLSVVFIIPSATLVSYYLLGAIYPAVGAGLSGIWKKGWRIKHLNPQGLKSSKNYKSITRIGCSNDVARLLEKIHR